MTNNDVKQSLIVLQIVWQGEGLSPIAVPLESEQWETFFDMATLQTKIMVYRKMIQDARTDANKEK